MATNYTSIKADIIEITVDIPQRGDIFLVDTQVWYWVTYPSASLSAQPYQITSYPKYIQDTLSVGATVIAAARQQGKLIIR